MSIKTRTKSEIKETTIVKLIGCIGKGETKEAARILDYILSKSQDLLFKDFI